MFSRCEVQGSSLSSIKDTQCVQQFVKCRENKKDTKYDINSIRYEGDLKNFAYMTEVTLILLKSKVKDTLYWLMNSKDMKRYKEKEKGIQA